MDAWTELTQAAIRDRIREREVEAARERLASISRSAAIRAAAIRMIVDARRAASTAPLRLETAAARKAEIRKAVAECEECPATASPAA